MHAATASETRKLDDQWGRNNFMVSASGFNMVEEIIVSYLSISRKTALNTAGWRG